MNFRPKKEEGSYKCWLVITFSQEVGYLGFLIYFSFCTTQSINIKKKEKKKCQPFLSIYMIISACNDHMLCMSVDS